MQNEYEPKSGWRENLVNNILMVLTIGIAFVGGYIFSRLIHPPELELVILSETQQLLEDNAFFELPESKEMEYGMIHGMLNTVEDPHTRFLEPVEHELNSDRLEGSYGGIGARLGRDEEEYIVLYPMEGSPAEEAGLLEGDRLIGVDETPVPPGTSFDEAVALVRGPEGKKVDITIYRPAEDIEITFSIKRGNIPTPSVTWHLDPDEGRLGVLEINWIADSTPDEIERAITDLQERGATHFVLDLRNNGGGLLTPGVDIARMFLEEGTVIERQKKGQDVESYKVTKKGMYVDLPLVIFVNEYTASSAEIISGALRAQNKVALIGRMTYGKNTMQSVYELNDGSSLHVTSAHWWVPDIEFPQPEGGGLLVDIEIEAGENETVDALAAAVEYFFGK